MFDPRIYRAAFLPAVAAFVVLMFSLAPVPGGLEQPIALPTFDGNSAARTARSIAESAPERQPGSEGDRAIADLVEERFGEIEGGNVTTDDFDSSFRGDDVSLRNVLLTLPGASEHTVLVVAGRDSADGPGTASSAAATAILLGLADDLADSRRDRTVVLASTDGDSEGGRGVRELISALPDPEAVEASIVISQPGVRDPAPPFVIASNNSVGSVSAQLIETARSITANAFGLRQETEGPWSGLARLAVPLGLGEQAILQGEGIESVALSSAGERRLPASEDTAENVSNSTLEASGVSALTLILSLDDAERPLIDDPGTYIRLGDNLIPGWTLSLLAIALLAPALLAAGDTWARELRNDWRTRRSVFWALERGLLPLGALFLVYVLGLTGLIPDPAFPFDPARYEAGAEAPVVAVAIAAVVGLIALLVRPLRTPLDLEPHTLAAAGGVMTGVSILGIWMLNPFLALLLAPAAHVWLLAARAAGPAPRGVIGAVALLALVPSAIAFATVASQLDLGGSAPWHLVLLIVNGQIGFLLSVLWCLMIGGLIACFAAAGARSAALGADTPRQRVTGTGGHAGPGALGSIPSSLPRR